MEILLIVPRYNITRKKDYNYNFPLGLGYISAVIKKAGYNLDCLNLNHLDGTVEDLVKKSLSQKKYDVVCSGFLGLGHHSIKEIIRICRLHPSLQKIIIGGALITSEPKLIFESLNPDFAIIGEGEITIQELLKSLEMKTIANDIRGIIYWNDKKEMIITPAREVINDLDSLPFPDFDLLELPEYLSNQSSNEVPYTLFDYPRPYPIICSRGCPFQCTFCYHCLGIKYRVRSLDNIIQEIRYAIEKYHINLLFFYDDLFAVNTERLDDFCKRIKDVFKEYPGEYKWFCQLTVQNVSEEMLIRLKDAGCSAVSYGLESYSPIILKSMKKPITPQQIDNAVKLTKKCGLIINGSFIFGDRAETKETARETLDYWKDHCNGQVQLNFIQPYPGTEMYKHCLKKGIITNKTDFIENQMYLINWFNMTDSMTDEEILTLKKKILELRIKHVKYISPLNVKKNTQGKYSIGVRCPYCENTLIYQNCRIDNLVYYTLRIHCKNCSMAFFMVSPLYKSMIKYYHELEFFRTKYITIRDAVQRLIS